MKELVEGEVAHRDIDRRQAADARAGDVLYLNGIASRFASTSPLELLQAQASKPVVVSEAIEGERVKKFNSILLHLFLRLCIRFHFHNSSRLCSTVPHR